MPNSLAYLALIAWPVVTIALFWLLPPERALVWSLVGALMVLPPVASINFPLVPPLHKDSIGSLAAFVACGLVLGRWAVPWVGSPLGRLLLVLLVVSPVATVLTNPDPILFKVGGLPGLTLYDAVSVLVNQAIFVLPLFLGRQLLAGEAAQRELLLALTVAMVFYSLPMLVEIRLSPQLNTLFYGFAPSDFIQQIRGNSYRPVVFMGHGLLVAFITMTAFLAAVGLLRAAPAEKRIPYLFAVVYLGVMLLLCKSMGSILYAIVFAPLIGFARRRLQVRLAAVLAVLVIAYPVLRGNDLVPVETMLAQAERVSAERERSLRFRFDNEQLLLDHAREKPLLGWGFWNRNNVFEFETGNQLSTTDGRWIIIIGGHGWVGYIVEFGLLALPLILLARRVGRAPPAAVSPYVGPLALMLAVYMVDMLPNAPLLPLTWLIAGALLGYAEALKAVPSALGASGPEGGEMAVPARPRTIL